MSDQLVFYWCVVQQLSNKLLLLLRLLVLTLLEARAHFFLFNFIIFILSWLDLELDQSFANLIAIVAARVNKLGLTDQREGSKF